MKLVIYFFLVLDVEKIPDYYSNHGGTIRTARCNIISKLEEFEFTKLPWYPDLRVVGSSL
jgi:hypothetical protein